MHAAFMRWCASNGNDDSSYVNMAEGKIDITSTELKYVGEMIT